MIGISKFGLGSAHVNKAKSAPAVAVTPKDTGSESDSDEVNSPAGNLQAPVTKPALEIKNDAVVTKTDVSDTPDPRMRSRSARKSRESLLWLSDDKPVREVKDSQPICSLPADKKSQTLKKRTEIVVTKTCDGLNATFGEIVNNVDFMELLSFIAEVRLRSFPHQGSRLDLLLRWAAAFARNVNDSTVLFGYGIHDLQLASTYIYGGCKLLCQIAAANSAALESIYSIFSIVQQLGEVLDFFGRKRHFIEENHLLLETVSASYADLLDFMAGITIQFKACSKIELSILRRLEKTLSIHVDSFFSRKFSLIVEIWQSALIKEHYYKHSDVSIRTLRSWLNLKIQLKTSTRFCRLMGRSSRHEQSFEWFYETLKVFRKGPEDVLLITGQAASGKSALMSYILEQLACPKGGLGDCDVVKYSFDGGMKNANTILSMLKTLSAQLLDVSAGHIALYKALDAAFKTDKKSSNSKQVEAALWSAVEGAVQDLSRPLVFLIDSLDRLEISQSATVFTNLQAISKSSKHCRAILSTRSAEFDLGSRCRHLELDAHIHSDVRRYFESQLRHLHFSEEHKHIIIKECSTIKIETFLQAQLFIQIIRRQTTIEAVRSIVIKLKGTVHDQLDLCCDMIDFKAEQTRLIFSVLLASKRAMTVDEMAHFLCIDIKTRSFHDKYVDVEELINKTCGGLVTVKRSVVCFTHAHVSAHLLALCRSGKLGFTLDEAHQGLVTRALIYVKQTFGSFSVEPSFQCKFGDSEEAKYQELVHRHHFLDYAVQNWIYHYRYSSWSDLNECPGEFKACFSGSVGLTILEGSSWHVHYHRDESDAFYRLALDLRRQVLGTKHKSIIQCLINVSLSHVRHSRISDAHRDIIAAWTLAAEVCGKASAVCVSLAEYYVELIEKMEVSERHEHYEHCETIYKFLWEHHKTVHSEHHEITLRYAHCLAELYVLMERHEHATTVLREIRMVTIKHYGHFHERSVKITQLFLTVLTKTRRHDECFKVCEGLIEASGSELDCWHVDRIRMTLRMFELYEREQQLQKAEKVLTELRLKLIEACKTHHEDHIHTARIEITLALARFLKRCKRDDEAKKLLLDLWAEYERPIHGHREHSHTLLLKIKMIANELKEWGVVTVAKKIFGSLCGWFKKAGHSRDVVDVSIGLSHCHHACKETESEETVLVELWETLITTCTMTKVDVQVVFTAVELVSFYEREHRWTEAKAVCMKLLTKTWGDFFSRPGTKCGLPREHREETIKLVLKLARVHVHLGAVHEAINLYLGVFRSCKYSLALDHHLVMETAEHLVTCYEEHRMLDEAFEVWASLRQECHSFLGHKHELTIKILYNMAHFCQRHERTGAEQYFLDIAVAFGLGEYACHSSSIEAVLCLTRIYQTKRYDASILRKCYYSLWLSFKSRGLGCGLEHQIILSIFTNYVSILKAECHHAEAIEWSCEFRKACIKFFGSSHWVSVKVTLEYALLLQVEQSRHEECILVLEEVCRHEKSHDVLVTIRERLAYLFSCHEKYHAKAEIIILENWKKCVETYGCHHERSLNVLVQYVEILIKMGHKDKAVKHLHTVIVDIFQSTFLEVERFFTCATVIAKLYTRLESTHILLKLVQEMRLQLFAGKRSSHVHYGCLIHNGHVREDLLVFLFTLESSCSGSHHSYDECIILAREEKMHWDLWLKVKSIKCSMSVSLAAGVQLLHFLLVHRRQKDADAILDAMWNIFCLELSIKATAKSGALYDFFTLYISTPINDGCLANYTVAAVDIITYLYTARSFTLCLSLGQWFHSHIVSARGGYKSLEMQAFGLRLAFCLTGRAHGDILCLDGRVRELGETLFMAVITARLSMTDMSVFHSCSYEEIESIIVILGQRKARVELEKVLAFIWETRGASQLEQSVLLSVAFRLVECRFAMGLQHSAIALAEDIVYNLRRVFGPLDALTIQFSELLASLCEECGEATKAVAVRRQLLQFCVEEDDEFVSQESKSALALRMIEGCRHLEFDESQVEVSVVVEQAQDSFQGVDERWKALDTACGWGKAQEKKPVQIYGCWTPPRIWSLNGVLNTA